MQDGSPARDHVGVHTVALFVATCLLSGLSYGSDWWALLEPARVHDRELLLKPVLAVLSIPFIIVTFGIFFSLINVLMLYLTHWIVPQFTLATFWWAALAAIIVSAVNGDPAACSSATCASSSRGSRWGYSTATARRGFRPVPPGPRL